MVSCFLFFEATADHRDLPVRTPSFPPRRSSDLGTLTSAPLPLCGRGATGRWWRLAGSRGAVGGLAPVCGAGVCRWSWVGGMVGRVGLGVPFDEVFPR